VELRLIQLVGSGIQVVNGSTELATFAARPSQRQQRGALVPDTVRRSGTKESRVAQTEEAANLGIQVLL
jgi:hypothetical protein